MCKLRPLEERFPEEFRLWIGNLTRLQQWHKAGYSLEKEGLSFEDWTALAIITRFYEVRDLEAAIPRAPSGSAAAGNQPST